MRILCNIFQGRIFRCLKKSTDKCSENWQEGGIGYGWGWWFQALLWGREGNWLGLKICEKLENTKMVREKSCLGKHCQDREQS